VNPGRGFGIVSIGSLSADAPRIPNIDNRKTVPIDSRHFSRNHATGVASVNFPAAPRPAIGSQPNNDFPARRPSAAARGFNLKYFAGYEAATKEISVGQLPHRTVVNNFILVHCDSLTSGSRPTIGRG
jgi:hypothetical protein